MVPLKVLLSRVTFSSLLRLAHEAGTVPLKRLDVTFKWRRPNAPAQPRAAFDRCKLHQCPGQVVANATLGN